MKADKIKPKQERLTKENMFNHKHSYIFEQWDQEIIDKIDFIDIVENEGSISGRVMFKQENSNKPPNPNRESQFDKGNDAPEVKK